MAESGSKRFDRWPIDFCTPIGTGTTPTGSGRLSATRHAQLLGALLNLRAARARALAESQSFVVINRG